MNRKAERQQTSHRPYPPELKQWMDRYLDHLAIRNYSQYTVKQGRYYLQLFLSWLDDRGVGKLSEIALEVLESHQRYLFHFRRDNGKRLSVTAQRSRLLALRSWFRWLRKQGYIASDPALDLQLPKEERRLPRGVLTATEVEQLMVCPDIRSPLGLRDRTILEMLYTTAMRRSELTSLKIQDVDLERRVASIWCGKGKKDRVVPIGQRAVDWLKAYVENSRGELLVDGRETALFITRNGIPLNPNALSDLVRKYVVAAGIPKGGGCHLLRHTAATLMLENGADVRHIQELLGHKDLSSTQIYTHVSISELRKIHDKTHPARGRANPPDMSRDDTDEDDGDFVRAQM